MQKSPDVLFLEMWKEYCGRKATGRIRQNARYKRTVEDEEGALAGEDLFVFGNYEQVTVLLHGDADGLFQVVLLMQDFHFEV